MPIKIIPLGIIIRILLTTIKEIIIMIIHQIEKILETKDSTIIGIIIIMGKIMIEINGIIIGEMNKEIVGEKKIIHRGVIIKKNKQEEDGVEQKQKIILGEMKE